MQLKLIAALILITSPCWAPITQNQTQQIQDAASRISAIALQMHHLAESTGRAISNGNSFKLDFSSKAYSLTAAQEQDIVNYYLQLKSQIQSELNALP